ncbi:glycosyltransferase family 4 protein [Priestia megaterium]|uniref:glycosyltransferase family 4 protein n=1 Tax=Priestia megaterium TaxID=1404 RepID=UPI00203E3BA6|nr:glycosyltransferase family 4 protein [Priestia megaterium]MCM3197159.1 glycosyltransferase family 4 protein [Priestia megaterium]
MRILLATYWPVPHVGGVWNYMEQLKEQLEILGHEVDLLGYSEDNKSYVHIVNENRKAERDKLVTLINRELNESSSPTSYDDEVVSYCELQRRIYELGVKQLGLEKYDVIHTQDVFSTTCLNNIRPKGSVLVATLHGCVAHEIRYQINAHTLQSCTPYLVRSYFDVLEYTGAISAEYTIVANQWLKNILTIEFRVPIEQIEVCHYGYDVENFLKQAQETCSIERPNDKKVIIYTGRLTEIKGVHHLISALSHLKVIRDDWVCWIVGDGEKKAELKNQSKVLGLENHIFFLGKRDDVPCLISNSDIFVLPSLIENQPLSVIEAQIAGKPMIVSYTGGLPEMVENGVTGLISPVGNIEVLCNNLNLLLENEEYRKLLGFNAQKWGIAHWTLNKGVEKVLKIYTSAILKKRKKETEE